MSADRTNDGDSDIDAFDDRIAGSLWMIYYLSTYHSLWCKGHSFTTGAKAGIVKEKSSGRILKLVDGDERGRRELSFYETIFHPDEVDNKLLNQFVRSCIVEQLLMFFPVVQLPCFLGRRIVLNREFIVLEDVSCGGKNVMDVKIGAVTWDDNATDQKIAAEKSKYTYGLELGFRLLGYRVRHCPFRSWSFFVTTSISGHWWIWSHA